MIQTPSDAAYTLVRGYVLEHSDRLRDTLPITGPGDSTGDERVIFSVHLTEVRTGDRILAGGGWEGTNEAQKQVSVVGRILAGSKSTAILADGCIKQMSHGGGGNVNSDRHHEDVPRTGLFIAEQAYCDLWINFTGKITCGTSAGGDFQITQAPAGAWVEHYRNTTAIAPDCTEPEPQPATEETIMGFARLATAETTTAPHSTWKASALSLQVTVTDAAQQLIVDALAQVSTGTPTEIASWRDAEIRVVRGTTVVCSGHGGFSMASDLITWAAHASIAARDVDTPGVGTHTYTLEYRSYSSVVPVTLCPSGRAASLKVTAV